MTPTDIDTNEGEKGYRNRFKLHRDSLSREDARALALIVRRNGFTATRHPVENLEITDRPKGTTVRGASSVSLGEGNLLINDDNDQPMIRIRRT